MTNDEKLQLESGNYMRIMNRIVEALACTKLSGREFRIILVVLRFTYGYNRKDAPFSTQFISEHSQVDATNVNKVVKRLEKMQIILVKRAGWQMTIGFNKYYKSWSPIAQLKLTAPEQDAPGKVSQERLKSDDDATATESKMTKSLVKNDYKVSQKRLKKSGRINADKGALNPKYNIKTTKDNTMASPVYQIKEKWHALATIQKQKSMRGFVALRNYEKADHKLDSVLNQRIIEHGLEACLQAVENYHQFMILPKERKRWAGYSWSCYEFFKRDKDNVVRFMDWETVVFNFCEEKSAVAHEPMSASKAIDMLKRDRTSSTMEKMLRSMDDEQYLEFKLWLKTTRDQTLITMHNDAIRSGVRKK